jgi:quinol monooxygenase YgiN
MTSLQGEAASMAVHVLAIIDCRPEHLEAVRAALRQAQAAVPGENGCEHYAFHADQARPTRVYAIERWRDPAALDAHGRAPAFQALARVLEGRATLDVRRLEPLG